jgi:glycosyltransferase involved in cell wall biosynthesis
MKFIFIESFDIPNWNGRIARTTKCVSESHYAIIHLAEGLTQCGHECSVVSVTNHIVEDTYNHVKYLNYTHLNDENTECDYIIATNYINDWIALNKIIHYKKIICILYNVFTNFVLSYDFSWLNRVNTNKVCIAYTSETSKMNILQIQPALSKYESILLYNSISSHDVYPVGEFSSTVLCVSKMNQFAFFASMSSGLQCNMDIVKYFPEFTLVTKINGDDVYKPFEPHDQMIVLEDTSKENIITELIKSKYFIYPPCVNTTFEYVVLEALLCGVVVIAPRLPLYQELFGDAICYIENKTETKDKGKDKDIDKDTYLDKIYELEKNPELRFQYMEKGVKLRDKYINTTICEGLLCTLE